MASLVKSILWIILLLLFPGCIVALAPLAAEHGKKMAKESDDSFKLKKPLSGNRLLSGDRIIIVTRFTKESINYRDFHYEFQDFAEGFFKGWDTPLGKASDRVIDFNKKIKEQINHREYANKLAGQIDNLFKNKANIEVIVETSLYSDKRYIVKDGDSMLTLGLVVLFEGAKPTMKTSMIWYASRSAVKHQEITESLHVLTKQMQERKIKPHDAAFKYKELLNQCDAVDEFVYISIPLTTQEWLQNNGALIRQELDKAIVQLSMQLEQTLSLGRSNQTTLRTPEAGRSR